MKGMSLRLDRGAVSAIAIAAGLAAAAPGALAQSAPAPDDGLGMLEEIIVTAQKREETLTSVPVAVSLVTGDMLENAGVNNAESVVALVPSLTFRKGTTNVNSSLNIRGIGTTSFSSGAEPSVSTVLDGVVLARSGMAFMDFVDLERIEVLRGPQGTLFGKNASGGVVNIVSRDPGNTPEGYGEIAYYEGNEVRLRAGASGPITDTVGLRVTGFWGSYDGNIRNVFNDSDTNGYERYGARAKLTWDAAETVSVTLIADYTKNEDECCADVIGLVTPTAANTTVFLPSIAPVVPGSANREIDNDLDPRTVDKQYGLSAQVDLEVGEHVVTSITAMRGQDNVETRDGDFRSDAPRFVNASVPGGDAQLHDFGPLSVHQYTQELRLTSPGGEFLDYTLGLFYYRTDQDNAFTRTVRTCTASTLPANANGSIPCQAGASTFQTISGTAVFDTDLENYAAFGQVTANLTEEFRAIGGFRFGHDKIDYRFQRVAPVTGPGISASFSSTGKVSKDDASFKAGLQYDLTEDAMVYATYSQGYKGPAFNIFFNMAAIHTDPLAPETSDAYEAGLKSELFDGAAVLSLAAFHAKYDGFQTNSFDVVAGATVTRLTNAGSVRTRGLEADLLARPMEGLSLTGGIAYTDAEVVRFRCPPPAATNCADNINGKDLPFSPDWKFSVNADYRLPLGDALPFDVGINTSYVWQSEQQYDLGAPPAGPGPNTIQDSYGLWDASLVFTDKEERVRLALMVKNITDQSFTSVKVPGAFIRQQIPREADRYYGASLRVSY